jgi:hypothetical protein
MHDDTQAPAAAGEVWHAQPAHTVLAALQTLFKTTPLDAAAWALIAGLGIAKFLAVEAEKAVLRRCGVRRL